MCIEIYTCMFLKVDIENYLEWYFTEVCVIFHMRPRKLLFQIFPTSFIIFLFSFARTLNIFIIFIYSPHLEDTWRDKLMLFQVTSINCWYSNIVCNIRKRIVENLACPVADKTIYLLQSQHISGMINVGFYVHEVIADKSFTDE